MRRRWLVCVTALVVLAGCGTPADEPGGSGLVGPSGSATGGPLFNTGGPGPLHQRARDILARYDTAIRDTGDHPRFVPVGDLIAQIGQWEPANGDNHKRALGTGQIIARGPLPDAPPDTAHVVWDGGVSAQVAVLSAEQALERLRSTFTGDCAGCRPLEVTGARLTTTQVATTRGTATAPAWEYTFAGTSVRVTRVAVADSAVVTLPELPWDRYDIPRGPTVEAATTSSSGAQVIVEFTGAVGPKSEPCGADYTAEAVESAHAVVVVVTEHPYPADVACRAIGERRSAVAQLAQPLGERAVLEMRQGLPVRVTITG